MNMPVMVMRVIMSVMIIVLMRAVIAGWAVDMRLRRGGVGVMLAMIMIAGRPMNMRLQRGRLRGVGVIMAMRVAIASMMIMIVVA
ncbi:hypothetical protein [Terrarubrum flagellatum]|uniref:hypothetical protein n=1 Tax=Terrirubrum flagellatum TaxID=2895980 RepID=UPI0031452572